MRAAVISLLSTASWLAVVQAVPVGFITDGTARTVGVAGVLGTLTVLVYRLGVWRQEMENTKSNVCAEVKAHRDESSANFARLDQRLDAIGQRITHLEGVRVTPRRRSREVVT